MKSSKHIKILGAGISGLAAAINLVKSGYKVEIFEKRSEVGKRFHGDFQGLSNLTDRMDALKELVSCNIAVNFPYAPLYTITLTNGKKKHDIIFKKPLHYLVRRGPFPGTFDYCLKEQALDCGITIHFGETLPPEESDIIATGPIPGKIPAAAKGIVFSSSSKNVAVAVCNDDLAYKGYSYLLVVNGHGCMASVVFDDLKRVEKCFKMAREYFTSTYDLNMKEPSPMGGVGSFCRNPRYRTGNALCIGEAAGLQDFVAGFGMRYAFQSGYLAAESIIHGFDYIAAAKKTFSRKLKACIVNRWLWETVLHPHNYSLLIDIINFTANRVDQAPHQFNPVQWMLYPFAINYIKKQYPLI
ncbi:NAD(P)/FAD-dependent oxidoreductase [Fibrobacterota bacterium]